MYNVNAMLLWLLLLKLVGKFIIS